MAYNDSDKIISILEQVFRIMPPLLNERQRRLLAASIARGYGRGGIKLVSDITGMDVRTIRSGIQEIEQGIPLNQEKIRKSGGGRKPVKQLEPDLLADIESIIADSTYGDSPRVISWTSLSLRDISQLLNERFGISAGKDIVSRSLKELGYSRQAGSRHPDHDVQFRFINKKAQEFIDAGLPVISTDTKKRELVGSFNNVGAKYSQVRDPGKVAPYGVYLVNDNTGFVNLGKDHDSSAFAVESIRRWWNIVGKHTFPDADKLYINCDDGGSSGWRALLWKYELALFAVETGLEVHVSHFPPGTSKWNRIEHRLFCCIIKSWEGRPLIDINTVVNLISSPSADQGLKVKCVVDTDTCSTRLKATDEMMSRIDIETVGPDEAWNYIIHGFK